MSGDWIKMQTDLSEDPIVITMAARLHVDEFSVVGRLHRIWSWADRHLADGLALGITPEWIDHFVRLEGFSIALLEAGWLAKIGKEIGKADLLDSFPETFLDSSRFLLDSCDGGDLGGVVFPRFFRFLDGKTTKTNTKTKTNTNPTRAGEKNRESEIGKESGKLIEKEIEKEDPRIEKDEAFSIFWKQYPRKDSKVPAQKAYENLNASPELQQSILNALLRFKACDQWTREGGKFIPYASTWLNQRRWEDETTPAIPRAAPVRTYHDERADTIAGLTGRSRHHDDDERTIDVPATNIAYLASERDS